MAYEGSNPAGDAFTARRILIVNVRGDEKRQECEACRARVKPSDNDCSSCGRSLLGRTAQVE